MAVVRWSVQARADLREIAVFYTERINKETSKRVTNVVLADIKKVAATPMLGTKDERLGDDYLYWSALRTQYRIYFKRVGPRTIQLYRIWPSRRRPIELYDLEP